MHFIKNRFPTSLRNQKSKAVNFNFWKENRYINKYFDKQTQLPLSNLVEFLN